MYTEIRFFNGFCSCCGQEGEKLDEKRTAALSPSFFHLRTYRNSRQWIKKVQCATRYDNRASSFLFSSFLPFLHPLLIAKWERKDKALPPNRERISGRAAAKKPVLQVRGKSLNINLWSEERSTIAPTLQVFRADSRGRLSLPGRISLRARAHSKCNILFPLPRDWVHAIRGVMK